MVTLDNISFEFAGRFLYKNTTLQIKPGDKLGLIGRNGTGKSTLLRIITGEYAVSGGNVSMPRNTKIGFLNQDLLSFQTENSAFEVALSAFEQELKLRSEIEELLARLEQIDDPEAVKRLTERQAELEARDGYNIELKTATLLAGLGFGEADQKMPFNTFSGGWRMRIMLAKILLQEPDLLLLDEPTNHLDLPSIKWIESYLQNFSGAFIIVSHDRFFLDRLVNRIVEIEQERFVLYGGNYTYFMKEKVVRREQQQREYENQQKMISETERFINRFRAKASKAKQVQSKIKLLDKVERILPPDGEAAVMSLKFQADVVPGKTISTIEVDNKAYGDKHILGKTAGQVMRGDKIALIGANGLGKSTLLRMIVGTEPFEGTLTPGHNVHSTFFAQHQLEALDPVNTLLEEMRPFMQKGETFVRNILGCFLFSGDDVQKKIRVLSGGEKSRVALAKTLLSQANFLLLDEPTNHLDIQSIEILIDALSAYDGSFLVVSHDRYFLGKIANKIWYIQDRVLKEYPGNYEEFEKFMNRQNDSLEPKKHAPHPVKKTGAAAKTGGKNEYEQEKRRKRRVGKLKSQLEKAEASIMELEAKKVADSAQMADPEVAANFQKLFEMQADMDKMDKELEALNIEWEKLVEELESYEG